MKAIALTIIAALGTSLTYAAVSASPVNKDDVNCYSGYRCFSCNGTGFQGNRNCIQCNGTGRNSSY